VASALIAGSWLALAPAAAAQLLASGDPGPSGAVLWARVDEPGAYRFELSEDAHFDAVAAKAAVRATATTGLTAQATVKGLKPETRYYYRLVTAAGAPLPAKASFATAPPPAQARAVKILFGADLGGQGYGRLRPGTGLKVDGWPIFVPMLAERPDLFLALGDMIYSDRGLTAEAPDKAYPKGNDFQIPKPGPGYVSNLEDFRRDWLYHRDDRHYDRFLKATPLVATWDDHELVNDTGCPELAKGPVPWGPKEGKGRRKSVFHCSSGTPSRSCPIPRASSRAASTARCAGGVMRRCSCSTRAPTATPATGSIRTRSPRRCWARRRSAGCSTCWPSPTPRGSSS